MRNQTCVLITAIIAVSATMFGCGGGGSNDSTSAAATGASSPTAASAPLASSGAPAAGTPAAAVPAQPATSASAPASTVAQSTTPNVVPITVAQIATGTRNMLQASVTICVPGTSTCQTIDNIQVDTGSQGLRILKNKLNPTLVLPSVTASTGSTAAACTVFGSGYTWGSVRTADVHLAGLVAAATSIQVISDPAIPTVPTDC